MTLDYLAFLACIGFALFFVGVGVLLGVLMKVSRWLD